MTELYVVSVVMIAVLALLAVLTPWFDDNTLQRTALSFICLGCTGELWHLFRFAASSDNARTCMVFGLALYSLGSALKAFFRYRKSKHHPVLGTTHAKTH